ncbi:MAG: Telomerase protein component 1 [Trichoglossum hirsutum]|nr:MAG: Telomerase protein component 1 [Trichoglossum hirsutum]
MASILRQIVAGPRSRHPEAGLDLCYVTDSSPPLSPHPKYQNFPAKSSINLVIATSGPSSTYPQRAYRNPLDLLVKFLDDKHTENWAIWEFRAEGTGYPDEEVYGRIWHYPWPDHHPPPFALVPNMMASMRNWLIENDERVVVVHCKAGKGRSGTATCSYLISECGWAPADALARFTERRMRPGFGRGVSIPSQLRWIEYVHQWTRNGKIYVERRVEILELHVWGLKGGVKVAIEGFIDEGKTIKTFHVFKKDERLIVDAGEDKGDGGDDLREDIKTKIPKRSAALETTDNGSYSESPAREESPGGETGGSAVIFKPKERVILPTNDINIDFERRNKAGYGWTMVTAVAHVWFNAFFEGLTSAGPNGNSPSSSGIFEIEWDKMDGIKGSPRKGTRALDRLAVVWKVFDESRGKVIKEPSVGEEVSQAAPADWKGADKKNEGLLGKDLGLRAESPASADLSKASSIFEGDLERGTNDSESSTDIKPEETETFQDLPQPTANAPVPNMADLSLGLDTASNTTPLNDEASKPSSSGGDNADATTTDVVTSHQIISTSSLPGVFAEGGDRDREAATILTCDKA